MWFLKMRAHSTVWKLRTTWWWIEDVCEAGASGRIFPPPCSTLASIAAKNESGSSSLSWNAMLISLRSSWGNWIVMCSPQLWKRCRSLRNSLQHSARILCTYYLVLNDNKNKGGKELLREYIRLHRVWNIFRLYHLPYCFLGFFYHRPD